MESKPRKWMATAPNIILLGLTLWTLQSSYRIRPSKGNDNNQDEKNTNTNVESLCSSILYIIGCLVLIMKNLFSKKACLYYYTIIGNLNLIYSLRRAKVYKQMTVR
jgi:hypothetical protein